MGREVVVAITGGEFDFGPWEQIFDGEFNGRRRKRVLVKIIGERGFGLSRHDSTWGVILTNARLPGISNQSSFRKLFIVHLPSSYFYGCARDVAKPHISFHEEEGGRKRRRELDSNMRDTGTPVFPSFRGLPMTPGIFSSHQFTRMTLGFC